MTEQEFYDYTNRRIIPRVEETLLNLDCQLQGISDINALAYHLYPKYEFFEGWYKAIMRSAKPLLDENKMTACLCAAIIALRPLKPNLNVRLKDSSEEFSYFYHYPNEVLAYFSAVDFIGLKLASETDDEKKLDFIFDGVFVPDSGNDDHDYLSYFVKVLDHAARKDEKDPNEPEPAEYPYDMNYDLTAFSLLFFHITESYRQALEGVK